MLGFFLLGMYPTMQKKDWVFQVCMVQFLILDVLSRHHSTVKLLTPSMGSIGQRIAESKASPPPQRAFLSHKDLTKWEMQLWELRKNREQEPSRIFCRYLKEKVQMVHQNTSCPNDHLACFREISANTEEKRITTLQQSCSKVFYVLEKLPTAF